MAGKQTVLLLALVVIAAISGISSAATHIVGGRTGWTVPSSPTLYTNWANDQTYAVGDVLVFNFPAGAHTVAEVNRRNYDSCGTSNTIGPVRTTSPANITLATAGTHYFICTIPGHCTSNQKLAVTVTGPSTSPASAPAPAGGAATPSGGAASPAGGSAEGPAAGGAAEGPAGGAAEGPAGAEGPGGATPAGSFATSTSVGLLSLVSVAVAALMY